MLEISISTKRSYRPKNRYNQAIGDGGPTAGPVGVPGAYHSLSAMVVTKNNTNLVLLQSNQYFLPKPMTKTASAP